MFTVYILYSLAYDKTYVGQTSDLTARMEYHNISAEKSFTSKYRPWKLMHAEQYSSRSEAMRKEKWFKTGAGRDEIKRIKTAFLSAGCGMESAAADSSSGS